MGQWEEEKKLSCICPDFKERLPASAALDFSRLRQTDPSPRSRSFFREIRPFTRGLVHGLCIMGPFYNTGAGKASTTGPFPNFH